MADIDATTPYRRDRERIPSASTRVIMRVAVRAGAAITLLWIALASTSEPDASERSAPWSGTSQGDVGPRSPATSNGAGAADEASRFYAFGA